MISIQRLNARGQNKNGEAAVDYLLATEYYTNAAGEREDNVRWGGKLAGELGLEGKAVDKQDMLQLAKGYAPDGRALCKNAGEEPREVVKVGRDGQPKLDKNGNPITKLEGGHRVGFDLTYSPPKPFSVAFAIAPPEERDRILEAHRKAVDVAMRYLEDKVETRRGKGGKDVLACEGLVYMQADHLASRELDMDIHTHTLVFGVAKGADGQWGTYDARELYDHRHSADAIYKNELAMNMRELGYSIEQERELNADGVETGQVLYKVAGIPDELCDIFSTRRKQILAYQAEHGVDAQQACLATRQQKDEPNYAELSKLWKDKMDALGPELVPTHEQLKQQQDKLMQPKSTQEILEVLHASDAVFTERDIVRVLGHENAGQVRFDQLMQKVEEFKKTTGLVAIEAEKLADEDKGNTLSRRHTETRYAAPWMVEWEGEVLHRIKSREGEHQAVPLPKVEQAIAEYQARKGFQLSDEQREAVLNLTTKDHGVGLLEGFAGTGKTTVSDCYSAAFKAQGRNMLGVCVSNAAAQKLEHESGMPCMSVSKMLSRLDKGARNAKGGMSLTSNDVLVVDEAGMMDTNQTRRLLAHAQKGGAKVILQGDENQLQPIGAGSGMSLAKMAVQGTKLTEIRRQAREEDRELAKMFYHRDADGNFADLKKGTRSKRETVQMGGRILEALDKRGALDDYDTQTQAIDALVDDYLKSSKPASEKLVLGHSRAEVTALNDALRAALKAKGEISQSETVVRTKDAGQWVEMPVAAGDRLRFTDSDQKLGVVNGSQGVLLSAKANEERGGVDLSIQLQSEIAKENGRIVSFNSQDYCAISRNLATTVHKAQGAGKEEVFHLSNTGMMDNHSSLVAFTRLTKGDYRMYGTTEDIERLRERFGLERLKSTAPGEGVKAETKETVREEPKALSQEEREAVENLAKGFHQRLAQFRNRSRELENGMAL